MVPSVPKWTSASATFSGADLDNIEVLVRKISLSLKMHANSKFTEPYTRFHIPCIVSNSLGYTVNGFQ